MLDIILTEYFKFRIKLRNYDLDKVLDIIKYSAVRYYDTVTNRRVVIGKHNDKLVLIPYEISDESVTPITIHAITKQQIKFRVKTGRLKYE
jgi:hypothetical protein